MKMIKSGRKQYTNPNEGLVTLAVIFRDNVDSIVTLLESVANQFDFYSFMDTGSKDGTRQIIEEFLKTQKGAIGNFEWCDDFAKARNASLKMNEGNTKWVMFLDTDDKMVDPDGSFRSQLKLAASPTHQHLKMIFVEYAYDVLETLQTMRIAPNDGEWHFEDAIHERLVKKGDELPFNPSQPNHAMMAKVFVQHLHKTAEQKEAALRRNATIAEREYKATNDTNYKARLARTIAMVPIMEGRLDEAMPLLSETATVYPHMPEGRRANSQLAMFNMEAGKFTEAMTFAKKAGPSYEALVHYQAKEYMSAIARQNVGATIPQQTTHEGFILEKVSAPIAMAHAALELGYHPTQVEQVMNSVRGDLRLFSQIAEVTQKIRGTVDRITIVVPGTPQPFDGNSGGTMLGGSEEAVVYLTKALAALGRNVRVYGILPALTMDRTIIDGVEWRPFSTFNIEEEHGTLVLWRAPGLCFNLSQQHQNARAKGKPGIAGVAGTSLWLHDYELGLPPHLKEHLGKVTSNIIVLSQFHKEQVIKDLGGDPGNIVILSNGIVRERFDYNDNPVRDPNSVVYSSCPTRGLVSLLRMWPEVKARRPDAKLDIYYDWAMVQSNHPAFYEALLKEMAAVEGLSVTHHGGVGHEELETALKTANIWAYSHFSNVLAETSCISIMKATAAGATVLTVPNGALPETAPDSHFFTNEEDYKEALIKFLGEPESEEVRKVKADRMLERLSWDSVAEGFSKLWTCVDGDDTVSECPTPNTTT